MKDYCNILFSLLIPLLYLLIMRKHIKAFLGPGRVTFLSSIVWCIYYVFQVANNIGTTFPLKLLLSGNILLVFLIISSSYRKSVKQRCIFSLLICTVWMLVEVIVMIVLRAIKFDARTLQDAGSFISMMCMLLLSVAINHCFKDNRYYEISWRYFLIILLIPASSIYIMHNIFLIAGSHPQYAMFSAITSSLLLLVNYVIFEIYDWISRDAELKEQNRLYEQQLELCNLQAEEREVMHLEIRRIKHDLKNHLTGLLAMIQTRHLHEAETYIMELLNDGIRVYSEEISHSGNIIVDSLLNHKFTLAQRENINFNSSVLIPAALPFQNGHLTIILGNLIENAIEACRKIPKEQRYISLNISYAKEIFQLIIKNSCQTQRKKDKSGHYLTTKDDTAHHGLGLSSVTHAVANYLGEIEIKDNGNEFQVTVIMYSPSGKNES